MIREHPILFSAEMIRAILAGSKTQTRRVIVTSRAKLGFNSQFTFGKSLREVALRKSKPMRRGKYEYIGANPDIEINLRCPYGLVGERLWVRETWFCDDYELLSGPYKETASARDNLYYRADDPQGDITNLIPECDLDGGSPNVWKPSIHMPRWASRINLEVIDICIERLQDITSSDAIDEGTPDELCPVVMASSERQFNNGPPILGYRDGFQKLWDSINAERGYSWQYNPWVWVIKFRRVET
jgi:hypothetical protein